MYFDTEKVIREIKDSPKHVCFGCHKEYSKDTTLFGDDLVRIPFGPELHVYVCRNKRYVSSRALLGCRIKALKRAPLCPVCGQQAVPLGEVCQACWSAIGEGEKALAMNKRDRVNMPIKEGYIRLPYIKDMPNISRAFWRLCEMAGWYDGYAVDTYPGSALSKQSVDIGGRHSRTGLRIIKAPQDVADAAIALLRRIHTGVEMAYKRGKYDGSDLLGRLVSQESTPEEFNSVRDDANKADGGDNG